MVEWKDPYVNNGVVRQKGKQNNWRRMMQEEDKGQKKIKVIGRKAKSEGKIRKGPQ